MKLTKLLMHQRQTAYQNNLNNILILLEANPKAKLLDLGCNDGKWTIKLAQKAKTNNIYGLDIVNPRLKQAGKLGIETKQADLNQKLPYQSNSFDIVHANQVIEHLNNTDLFISEIYRILKKGAYAVISTENLASWHNIFALVLGFMPFSLTNVTMKTADLGNPLAPNYNKDFYESSSWQHQRVFTIHGLSHLFKLHGFKIEKVLGSGYYPFGNLLANIDKKHCAFITFKIRK